MKVEGPFWSPYMTTGDLELCIECFYSWLQGVEHYSFPTLEHFKKLFLVTPGAPEEGKVSARCDFSELNKKWWLWSNSWKARADAVPMNMHVVETPQAGILLASLGKEIERLLDAFHLKPATGTKDEVMSLFKVANDKVAEVLANPLMHASLLEGFPWAEEIFLPSEVGNSLNIENAKLEVWYDYSAAGYYVRISNPYPKITPKPQKAPIPDHFKMVSAKWVEDEKPAEVLGTQPITGLEQLKKLEQDLNEKWLKKPAPPTGPMEFKKSPDPLYQSITGVVGADKVNHPIGLTASLAEMLKTKKALEAKQQELAGKKKD